MVAALVIAWIHMFFLRYLLVHKGAAQGAEALEETTDDRKKMHLFSFVEVRQELNIPNASLSQ